MKEELFARLSRRYLALGIHKHYSQKIQRCTSARNSESAGGGIAGCASMILYLDGYLFGKPTPFSIIFVLLLFSGSGFLIEARNQYNIDFRVHDSNQKRHDRAFESAV